MQEPFECLRVIRSVLVHMVADVIVEELKTIAVVHDVADFCIGLPLNNQPLNLRSKRPPIVCRVAHFALWGMDAILPLLHGHRFRPVWKFIFWDRFVLANNLLVIFHRTVPPFYRRQCSGNENAPAWRALLQMMSSQLYSIRVAMGLSPPSNHCSNEPEIITAIHKSAEKIDLLLITVQFAVKLITISRVVTRTCGEHRNFESTAPLPFNLDKVESCDWKLLCRRSS